MGEQFKLFTAFIITTKLCSSQVLQKIPNHYFGFNDLIPSSMTMTNVSSKVLEKISFYICLVRAYILLVHGMPWS